MLGQVVKFCFTRDKLLKFFLEDFSLYGAIPPLKGVRGMLPSDLSKTSLCPPSKGEKHRAHLKHPTKTLTFGNLQK